MEARDGDHTNRTVASPLALPSSTDADTILFLHSLAGDQKHPGSIARTLALEDEAKVTGTVFPGHHDPSVLVPRLRNLMLKTDLESEPRGVH